MIYEFEGKKPRIAKNVFIADSAEVLGDVDIGENSSIWFGAVVRGDQNFIKIGRNSNVQDNSVVHVNEDHCVEIGDRVVIGHKAIIHGTKIKGNCIIGMGSILLNGSEVGENCIIGAGAVIVEDQKIPSNSIAVGIPAKVVKQVSAEHLKRIEINWQEYVELNSNYLKWQKTRTK